MKKFGELVTLDTKLNLIKKELVLLSDKIELMKFIDTLKKDTTYSVCMKMASELSLKAKGLEKDSDEYNKLNEEYQEVMNNEIEGFETISFSFSLSENTSLSIEDISALANLCDGFSIVSIEKGEIIYNK